MKIYNSRLDAVLDIIKISQLNAKEFEEVTGLTRSRLYSWRSGKVKNINTGTAEEIGRKLGYTLSISENGIRACKIDENQDTFVDRPIKPELEELETIISESSFEVKQLEEIKKLIGCIVCKNETDEKYIKLQEKYHDLLEKYLKLKEYN
jgi:transcriptional regulator with XRE-family HTH domain